MAKIETRCTKCGKYGLTVDVKTSILFGQEYTTTILQCGHRIIKKNEKTFKHLDRDEYFEKLYPFQQRGVEFIESAGFRCLVADEMGLGKTVQALMAIRYHKELLPVLYVVKSAVKYQWQQQILKWLKRDDDIFASIAQVVENGNSSILPVQHVIISMDMLEKFKEKIIQHGFKTIVIDESQNFKSLEATRTSALTEIITQANITNVICLTGTPILNRASEFFTTLNILRPEQWRFYDSFVRQWCESNYAGTNIGGIKSWKREEFKERTKSYIIRREKREVLVDLPKFTRNYEWIKIEDEVIRKAYNSQLKELQKHLKQIETLHSSAREQMSTLGYLEKLRQITALSKIPWIVEYVESFLTIEENEKIIIGLHHELAIESLREALGSWNPISITGKDTAEKKFEKVQRFQNDPNCRIMLASILAAGEGLDGLQYVCSQMVTVERMWNMSKERQFEARIDRHGQTSPVTNTLLLAKGTVDEYFTETVLEKENYVLSAVDHEKMESEMSSHYSSLNYVELAEKCVANFI